MCSSFVNQGASGVVKTSVSLFYFQLLIFIPFDPGYICSFSLRFYHTFTVWYHLSVSTNKVRRDMWCRIVCIVWRILTAPESAIAYSIYSLSMIDCSISRISLFLPSFLWVTAVLITFSQFVSNDLVVFVFDHTQLSCNTLGHSNLIDPILPDLIILEGEVDEVQTILSGYWLSIYHEVDRWRSVVDNSSLSMKTISVGANTASERMCPSWLGL